MFENRIPQPDPRSQASAEEIQNQLAYDKFVRFNPPRVSDQYNASSVHLTENIIFNQVRPDTLIDIGCGTGRRMFPYYHRCGINFVGIEKHQNLIDSIRSSGMINGIFVPDRERVVNLDVGQPGLTWQKLGVGAPVDMVVMLGGTICGIHSRMERINCFENVSALLKHGGTFLCDFFTWDSSGFRDGGIVQGFRPPNYGEVVPQYLPSISELRALGAFAGLNLVSQSEEAIQQFNGTRLTFVQFRKTKT